MIIIEILFERYKMICNNCKRDKGDVVVCPYCHVGDVKPFQPHHLPAGTLVGKRYEIFAVLGEGGFGITYLANDIILRKQVAIKEYFPHGFSYRNSAENNCEVIVSGGSDVFDHGKKRFLSEANILARFSGQPGIVNVMGYLEENNTVYLVMEYLNGTTLLDYLKKNGTLDAKVAFNKMLPIIDTLEKIHKDGVIHRDISPDNIMILRSGEIKLMDFGAAKEYIDSERSMSVLLKTGYAPEEQYRRHSDQGQWTDVYALCATLYRCITGKVPVDSLNRLVNDTLQRPSQMGIAITPALENVLMYGLAVRKQDRCQNMTELKRLIHNAMNQKAPAADPADHDPYLTVDAESTYHRDSPKPHIAEKPPGESNPSKAARQEKTEKTELNFFGVGIKAWAGILMAIAIVLDYLAIFTKSGSLQVMTTGTRYFWIGILGALTVLGIVVNYQVHQPQNSSVRKMIVAGMIILSVLSIYSVIGVTEWKTPPENAGKPVSSFSVKETDATAESFKKAVDYVFSFNDCEDYYFPSEYDSDTYHRRSDTYIGYSTEFDYAKTQTDSYPAKVTVCQEEITINQTTVQDLLDKGWKFLDEIEPNKDTKQSLTLEKGYDLIFFTVNSTGSDPYSAAISGISVYDFGNFDYNGIRASSGIGSVTAILGDPLSYSIDTSQSIDTKDKMTNSEITLEYQTKHSDVKITFEFEYDPKSNSCKIITFFITDDRQSQ